MNKLEKTLYELEFLVDVEVEVRRRVNTILPYLKETAMEDAIDCMDIDELLDMFGRNEILNEYSERELQEYVMNNYYADDWVECRMEWM